MHYDVEVALFERSDYLLQLNLRVRKLEVAVVFVLPAAELAGLPVGEEHSRLSLLVVVDLDFVQSVVNILAVIFVLFLGVWVLEEMLVFSLDHAFFAVARVASVDGVGDRRCLDDWSEKFKDPLLDLPWRLVRVEEDDPGLSDGLDAAEDHVRLLVLRNYELDRYDVFEGFLSLLSLHGAQFVAGLNAAERQVSSCH